MMSPGKNPADSIGPSPNEERLGELINEFVDRRSRGENLSEEAFLAEHPEHADELRQHLCGLELLEKLGSSALGDTLPGSPVLTPKGSSSQDSYATSDKIQPDIAGYKILKQVGRGGMGVVFKAIQVSTKRAVALKLLLEGPLASDSSRRRFEREVALAAQLKHQNIIPIYDSGVAEGRMYYAMEYVHGLAVGEYLKLHKIDIPAKLRLFARICTAVSHAHQRGVVHRDLKPSNILIDSDNEPHILDFGLAKAAALGDMTTSVSAQIIGTPAYMSPEQAAGDPTAIDTRSDAYSLGVVLYEMLTGQMPYDTSSAMGQVLQNIAHAEPTPPGKLHARVDSELSAIVLKALEKNKDDRYQSVDTLCSDVQRYLAGEPISARPASGLYLFRKAIRNNPVAVGFGSLIVFFAAVTWSIAHHYAGKFEHTEQEVRQLQDEVSVQKAVAEKHRKDAEAVAMQRTGSETPPPGFDVLLRNMDPEVAKVMGSLAQEFSDGVNRGEDPRMAFVRSLAAFGEIGQDDRQQQQKPLSKDYDFDLSQPFMAPSSDASQEHEAEVAPTEADFAKAVETITRFLQSGVGTQPPTSQLSTSRPYIKNEG